MFREHHVPPLMALRVSVFAAGKVAVYQRLRVRGTNMMRLARGADASLILGQFWPIGCRSD